MDLIDRQAAIDALGKDPGFKVRLFGKSYDEGRSDQWFKDVYKLTTVPSAQPDLQQTCTDCISRQDAVSRFSDLLMVELKGKRLPTWDEVYNAMQDVHPHSQRQDR